MTKHVKHCIVQTEDAHLSCCCACLPITPYIQLLMTKLHGYSNVLTEEHVCFLWVQTVRAVRIDMCCFSCLQAAMDFCMNMNTKSNRRKLVRALFTVPRQRWDSLPAPWNCCCFNSILFHDLVLHNFGQTLGNHKVAVFPSLATCWSCFVSKTCVTVPYMLRL